MSVKGLAINITTNAKSTLEALGRVKEKATDLEKGIKRLSNNMSAFGSMATKGLTVPIAATTTALGLLTKKAIDFRTQMREVQTLLPNLTNEGFENLNKKALELSKNIGVMPDKVVPALYQAISAGVPEANVFNFLETAGKLAVGGVTTLETAVDGLTSVVNAYGSSVIDVEKASDIMFTTVKLGKTNAEELSKSLFNVIPTASAAGVKFNEVGAALALMTAQGVPTSVATTQLMQAIVELNKSSTDTAKTFNALTGKTFKEFIAGGGSLQDALSILEKEANKNNKSISDMFGSVEAGNAALSLTGNNANSFTANLKEMSSAAGATQKAFDTMELDEGRQFEKLKVEVTALMTELGSKLIPVVRSELLPLVRDDIMPVVKNLIETTGRLIEKYRDMSPIVKSSSLVFVGFLAALGPTLSMISGGIKTITALKTAWLALNATIALTPIGATLAVAGAITALALAQAEKRKQEEKATAEAIKNSKAIQEQITQYSSLKTKTDEVIDRYDYLAKKTNLTTAEQVEMSKIVSKLKDIYPELNLQVDKNGRLLDDSRASVNDFTTSKEKETLALLENTQAVLKESMAKKQARIDAIKYDPRAMKNSDNIKLVEKEEATLKLLNEQYNKNNQIQNGILQTQRARAQLSASGDLGKEKLKEIEKNTDATIKNTNANKENDKSKKDKIKTFNEYIKSLEEELKAYDRSEAQLKAINKEYDNTGAIEKRNAIVKKNLLELTSNIDLSAKELELISKKYGHVLASETLDKNNALFNKLTKEIESSLKTYDENATEYEKMGKKISNENKKLAKEEIVNNGIDELISKLSLIDEHITILRAKFGDLYGLELGNNTAFTQLQKEIEQNIIKYEKQIELEKQLGKNFTDAEIKAGKSEIVREGIDKIINSLELTEDEIEILKNKWGDLYGFVKKGSEDTAKSFKDSWVDVLSESTNSLGSIMNSMGDIQRVARDRELELIEEKRQRTLAAIDEEKKAYLQANKAVELSERQRINKSVKELKDRQKVALGLYEQERLKKEIAEKEAAEHREIIEEETQAKIQELEKNTTNERLKIEYEAKTQEFELRRGQALVSQSQAMVNAVQSGMGSGFPLIFTPIYTGIALAQTIAQLVAMDKAKPKPPKYLAEGGLVKSVGGGVNAVIGEGKYDEVVAPLSDKVFERLAEGILKAQKKEDKQTTDIITKEITTTKTEQPIFITLNGKVLGEYILNATSRGVKLVSNRGVI